MTNANELTEQLAKLAGLAGVDNPDYRRNHTGVCGYDTGLPYGCKWCDAGTLASEEVDTVLGWLLAAGFDVSFEVEAEGVGVILDECVGSLEQGRTVHIQDGTPPREALTQAVLALTLEVE